MTGSGRPNPQTADLTSKCKNLSKTDRQQIVPPPWPWVRTYAPPAHIVYVSFCHLTADVSLPHLNETNTLVLIRELQLQLVDIELMLHHTQVYVGYTHLEEGRHHHSRHTYV
jgi:hypothetical protein